MREEGDAFQAEATRKGAGAGRGPRGNDEPEEEQKRRAGVREESPARAGEARGCLCPVRPGACANLVRRAASSPFTPRLAGLRGRDCEADRNSVPEDWVPLSLLGCTNTAEANSKFPPVLFTCYKF